MSTTAMSAPTVVRHRSRSHSRGVAAHPPRQIRGMVRGSVAACSVRRAAPAPRVSPLLRLKVFALGLLAVVGGVVGVTGYVQAISPDPAVDYVSGDPGWAHVEE